MLEPYTICLMNDSFPPIIDGVANTVMNYATYYQKNFGNAVVAVPYHPKANDEFFSFPVIRYRSFDTTRILRYRTGYPFSVRAMKQLKEAEIDLIHSHCPFMSMFLARAVREVNGAPIIFTYHTKFDIDIAKTVPTKKLQRQAIRLVVNNIRACDEVWVVSRGAGENLRSLGYQGDYIIMENGVDYPKGRVSENVIQDTVRDYDLPEGVPVYLFVGRMMWYKGLKLVFDGLKCIYKKGNDFRMILVGDGSDRYEMEKYVKDIGLDNKCFFIGAINNREILRSWYCRADLFLFPSGYDTNGLVVREAAACGLASVLIKGSCAAEGVKDGVNGFLCEDNCKSLAAILSELQENPEMMRQAGNNAMEQLYLSWEDSVAKAAKRYEIIMEMVKSGELEYQRRVYDELIQATTNVMDKVEIMRELRECTKEELHAMYEWQKSHLGRLTESLWNKINTKYK